MDGEEKALGKDEPERLFMTDVQMDLDKGSEVLPVIKGWSDRLAEPTSVLCVVAF